MAIYEILDRIGESDPELLVGDDQYVLDCSECPLDIPETVAKYRLAYLTLKFGEFLEEISQDGTHTLVDKLTEWVSQSGLDPTDIGGIAFANISNYGGNWQIGFSEKLGSQLRSKGVNPDVFLAGFNDQHAATLSEVADEIVQHAIESHPGVVICGGRYLGERALCGAQINALPCEDQGTELAEQIIFVSAQRRIAREFL